MSADNGIYIGKFLDGIRVIHAQAIDNVFYPDGENAAAIVDYFGRANTINSLEAAQKEAFRMEEEILNDDFCPILEYGVSTLTFSKPFSEYAHEVEEQKKYNENNGD